MTAADIMYRHRYGAVATPAQPRRGPTAPAAPQSPREVATRRAALEFKQFLDAAGTPTAGEVLRGRPPYKTAYTFAFRLPVDQVFQQYGPTALQIGSRHGTGVTVISSYRQGYPEAIVVFADDPASAHNYYKTGHLA